MKEDLILESFKQYHNANWHDGDNTFDGRTYAKSNGDATSSDADFDDQFVQDCYDHYEAGYEKAWQETKAQVIPDGFVLVPKVPKVPTDAMLDASRRRQWDDLSSPYEGMDMLKYKAMIGAVE